MKKHFKKIGVVLSVVFLILFFLPQEANACIGVLGAPTFTECVISLFEIILDFFKFLFGLLLSLAVWMVGLIWGFNLEIAKSQLVTVGWSIARDIANLGLVLVIIIVAVATIVRFQTYGAKALLPKLIAAAIIVNFSLNIGYAFIGFSNVLTSFFLDKIGGNNFPTVVAGAFGPQKFLLPSEDPLPPNPADEAGALATFGAAVLSSIGSLGFVVIFTLLVALVMFALAFMLFMRYLYLSFLLVLAPIIWLFWVIPALSNHFSKWWSKFFEWVFFAPTVAFFLYLAVTTLAGMKGQPTYDYAKSSHTVFGSPLIAEVMAQGMQMLVAAGIIVFGLILAQNMGIAGAQAAVGAAKGMGKGVGKYMKTRGLQGAQLVAKGATYAGGKAKKIPFVKRTLEWTRKAGKGFDTQKYKGLAKVGAGLSNIVTAPARGVIKAAGQAAAGVGKFARKDIKPTSFMGAIFKGMKEGSGLFKSSASSLAKTTEELQEELEKLMEKLRRGEELTPEEENRAAEISSMLEARRKLRERLTAPAEKTESSEERKEERKSETSDEETEGHAKEGKVIIVGPSKEDFQEALNESKLREELRILQGKVANKEAGKEDLERINEIKIALEGKGEGEVQRPQQEGRIITNPTEEDFREARKSAEESDEK